MRGKPPRIAVDGPALAGGTEIGLACDLLVASRTAVFGIPEVKRNQVAAAATCADKGTWLRYSDTLAPQSGRSNQM